MRIIRHTPKISDENNNQIPKSDKVHDIDMRDFFSDRYHLVFISVYAVALLGIFISYLLSYATKSTAVSGGFLVVAFVLWVSSLYSIEDKRFMDIVIKILFGFLMLLLLFC